MERRFGYHGLLDRVRFVEAVPAESPLVDQRLAGLPVPADSPLRRNEAACYSSHMKGMRIFLAEAGPFYDGAIICEDDVLLHNDWYQRLADILANLPDEATLCHLGYLTTDWEAASWAGRAPDEQNLLTFSPSTTWGCAMYWISADYARAVIDRWDLPFRHLPPGFAPEMFMQWSNGFLCYPPLALEDAIDSTIRPQDEIVSFHLPLMRWWPYQDYSACEQGEELSPLATRHPEHPVTVGLAVIARDEEASLPALLASCVGAFDQVVLLDTGSTDGTVARFLEWSETQPMTRCVVEHFTWCDDFASARQRAEELLDTDWHVWADCDDEISGATNLRQLAADAPRDVAGYRFGYDYARDDNGTCTCYMKRERMVRAGHGHWVGVVHEVQNVDGTVDDVGADTAEWIHHRERKALDDDDPPERPDIAVLTAALAQNPGDTRTVFYLAQSHRDSGHRDEAITLYEQRAEMGGWAEEVFYSRYQAGSLRCHKGDWVAGMRALLQAWEYRPSRTEPLYELAWRLRSSGDHRGAYLFARHGLDRPMPDDSLFVQPWVYRWGLLFECSISAFWIGETAEAEQACLRLLAMRDLPSTHRQQTAVNLEMVRGGLAARAAGPPMSQMVLGPRTGEIRLDVDPPWPSVRAAIGGGAASGGRMLVRTTEPVGGRRSAGPMPVRTTEPGDGRRSADYLVELGPGLDVASVQPVSLSEGVGPEVEGHRDHRLVCLDGAWLALATLQLGGDRSQPGLLDLGGGLITGCTALAVPDDVSQGAIWLPFIANATLQFLHVGDRSLVSRYDPDRRSVEPISEPITMPWTGPALDGSPGVPVRDGHLFVVSSSEGHRLFLLGSDWQLLGASRPWTVMAEAGERCGGMAAFDDQLVISFSGHQRRATLALLALNEALSLLE